MVSSLEKGTLYGGFLFVECQIELYMVSIESTLSSVELYMVRILSQNYQVSSCTW